MKTRFRRVPAATGESPGEVAPALADPPPADPPPVVVRRRGRVVDLRGTERVRYEKMIRALSVLTRLALVTALGGLLLPDPLGDALSAVAVTVVVAAPLARVAWLAIRWYRRGDARYSAVAASLLLVVGTGSVVAVLTR